MDAKQHRSQLEKAIRVNRLQNISIIMLTMMSLYFGFYALKGAMNAKIIITPPVVHEEFWVKGNEVSSSYLKEMAYYYMTLVMNVTPHTVDYQTDVFLKYVDSSYYQPLKTRMDVTAGRIKRDNISTVFMATRLDVDDKSRRVLVTGALSTYVGNTMQSQSSRKYLVEFSRHGVRLLVTKLCLTDDEGQVCKADAGTEIEMAAK